MQKLVSWFYAGPSLRLSIVEKLGVPLDRLGDSTGNLELLSDISGSLEAHAGSG
jgi:hypothetical protein